jgi:hypothetical protein
VPTDPTPTWITEGGAVPLARLTSTTLYVDATSYMLLLAFTSEALKLGDPRASRLATIRSARAITKADGALLFGDAAASGAQPAGILWNRTAVGSGSPGNLTDDLATLVAEVSNGDPFSPVFACSARGAAFLNASGVNAFRDLGLNGGTIAGAPCLIDAACADQLVLMDASEIAIADGGLEITASENASIEMVDNPSGNAATSTGASVVSAWQTGASVLRYVRSVGWRQLRQDAAAFIQLPIGGSPA